MSTILTIDLDIMMAPSLPFYDPLVPNASWDEILSYPIGATLQADLSLYQKVTNYILHLTKTLSAKDIIFITNHDEVLNHISEPVDCLINIDHHHDLGYHDDPQPPINPANWVEILMNNNQCKQYIWIHNENSQSVNDKHNYPHQALIFRQTDLCFLPTPDKVFICLSPDWIPPDF